MPKEMIRGAGKTCIFFHNACLSQHVLGGKHPSLPNAKRLNPYIKLSAKNNKIMVMSR